MLRECRGNYMIYTRAHNGSVQYPPPRENVIHLNETRFFITLPDLVQ